MKTILVISVLLNAVLLLAVSLSRRHLSSPPTPNLSQADGEDARATSSGHFAQNSAPARTGWGFIESQDLTRLIANLRAVGCPEQTVQDIVCLRLCRGQRQKLLARTAALERSMPYWKAPTPEYFREQRALRQDGNDELDASLEGLFGGAGRTIKMRVAGFSEAMIPPEYLPDEQARLVRIIDRRYRQSARELDDATLPFGFIDLAEREQVQQLARQKAAEIQQALTPEQYQQYVLHDSPAANYVRTRLPEAKSEEEYRKMVQVAAEFEMDPALVPLRQPFESPAEDQEPAQQQAAFQKRLAEVLGEDRVQAQEQDEKERERKEREESSQRESIQQITEVGATVEQGTAFYKRIQAMQPELEQRAKEMHAEGTPEQRKAFEQFLKAEFERVATEIMGAEKAKALVQKMDEQPR